MFNPNKKPMGLLYLRGSLTLSFVSFCASKGSKRGILSLVRFLSVGQTWPYGMSKTWPKRSRIWK